LAHCEVNHFLVQLSLLRLSRLRGDWGGGMSAGCTAGLIVRWSKQRVAA